MNTAKVVQVRRLLCSSFQADTVAAGAKAENGVAPVLSYQTCP